MDPPRRSISGLMIAVLVAAIALAAIRAASRPGAISWRMAELLIIGALPMGAVLGSAAIVLAWSRRSGALLGFVVGGSFALLLYLTAISQDPGRVTDFFLRLFAWTSFGPGLRLAICIGATILLLQLVPAAIGAWACRGDRPAGPPRR